MVPDFICYGYVEAVKRVVGVREQDRLLVIFLNSGFRDVVSVEETEGLKDF